MENIQLDAARTLTGATKLCSTQKLYTGLELLNSRRSKHKLCQLYKMINNLNPHYLQQLLPQRVNHQSRYSLRNINNFSIPGARTTLHFNSFLLSTLRQWNMLEQGIRDSSTLYSFKRKLNAQQQQLPPPHRNLKQTSHLG